MADNTHHVNLGLPSAHGHPAHGRWAQLGKKNFPIISTLRRHGVHGPATHKRNSISTPIDGIWVTSGIKVEKAGYFSYDEVVMNTDHRCLWIDVPFASVFGQDIPPSRRKAARRLHCKDPTFLITILNFIINSLHHYNSFSECLTWMLRPNK
jgi:hypothetical protein